MVFLPRKGPYKEPLPSTSFPKVNLSASLFIQKRTALQTCHSWAAELTLGLTYWERKIVWHPTLIFLQSHRKRGWKQPDLLSWLTLLSTSGESHTFFYLNTPETHEFLSFTHRTLISVQSITWESALTFRKDKSEAILMLKIKTHDRDPSLPLSSVSNKVSKSHSGKQPASQMPKPMVCQRTLERRHLWWQRDKI